MKKHFVFYLYNFSVALVLALIIETTLGYWLYHPNNIPTFLKDIYVTYYQFQDRSIIQVTECGRYDKGLFYTLTPGECYFNNREFSVKNSINTLGLRDDEASLASPSIILLGDSFTMGWGVEQNATFSAILEKKLGEKVLNAGVSSYGTPREMKLLSRLKRDNLQYLIIQYHPTDYEENLKYFNEGNKLIISSEKEYNDLKAYINKRQKYFPGKHIAYLTKFFLLKIGGKLSDGSVRYQDNEEAKLFLNSLTSSGFDFSNIQILIFEVESFARNDDLFITHLRKQIEEGEYPAYIKNIKVIPLADTLNETDYFILDDHINKNGHAKIADKIYQALKTDLKLSINK